DAEEWTRTVAAGFEEDGSPADASALPAVLLDTFYALGFARGATAFAARVNGAMIGGGVLHIFGDIAYIRTASCRFEYRFRGVQTALLAARLATAESAGCTLAFSSTDRSGASAR